MTKFSEVLEKIQLSPTKGRKVFPQGVPSPNIRKKVLKDNTLNVLNTLIDKALMEWKPDEGPSKETLQKLADLGLLSQIQKDVEEHSLTNEQAEKLAHCSLFILRHALDPQKNIALLFSNPNLAVSLDPAFQFLHNHDVLTEEVFDELLRLMKNRDKSPLDIAKHLQAIKELELVLGKLEDKVDVFLLSDYPQEIKMAILFLHSHQIPITPNVVEILADDGEEAVTIANGLLLIANIQKEDLISAVLAEMKMFDPALHESAIAMLEKMKTQRKPLDQQVTALKNLDKEGKYNHIYKAHAKQAAKFEEELLERATHVNEISLTLENLSAVYLIPITPPMLKAILTLADNQMLTSARRQPGAEYSLFSYKDADSLFVRQNVEAIAYACNQIPEKANDIAKAITLLRDYKIIGKDANKYLNLKINPRMIVCLDPENAMPLADMLVKMRQANIVTDENLKLILYAAGMRADNIDSLLGKTGGKEVDLAQAPDLNKENLLAIVSNVNNVFKPDRPFPNERFQSIPEIKAAKLELEKTASKSKNIT